jgi:hypothetical protein
VEDELVVWEVDDDDDVLEVLVELVEELVLVLDVEDEVDVVVPKLVLKLSNL